MAFSVKLEVFEGPLELLLYLIRRDRLNIYEIPIAHITNEYLSYIKFIRELDIEIAGEFLEIASLLLRIKAKSLLPIQIDSENEDLPDPREELTRRLLLYQEFREKAFFLRELEKNKYLRYPSVHRIKHSESSNKVTQDIIELVSAAREVNLRLIGKSPLTFILNMIPLEVRIDQIKTLIDKLDRNNITFADILEGKRERSWIVVNFISLLELVKNSFIKIHQNELYGNLWVKYCTTSKK